MDWTPGGTSDDIEDRRGDSGGGGGFNFGGMGGGLGLGGFILMLILSLVTGRNFLGGLFSGGGSAPARQAESRSAGPVEETPSEKRSVQLISWTLDDAQKTWEQIFTQQGKTYRHAKLVLFRDTTYSGCGNAQSATGPFYCPVDQKVYIDLSFWNELQRFGGGTSDFAEAYVITHEIGHHVQRLLGIESNVQRLMYARPQQRSQLSVALELQADCFAGIWAHSAEQRGHVHTSDIADGMKAAAAVGDDHLQKMAGRAVSPERFTHGSSAQRQQWLERGLESGSMGACNTFKGISDADNDEN
ncbi:KPN_02809 family neutral zinc metallopeptidase [Terriglobus tenax]|uniref:KPN_02809 family neutral zinc metallopeptidase n=1 Tax=Terriglobus tenax TaxID=1111115 RepID=UPI0021E02708|nr:neutral zinc metallopeptidase [Terriglobus tenax]